MATPSAHRSLVFTSYPELVAELDRLEASHQAGTLVAGGAWSAGQIFQHVARFIRFSYDGFPFSPPWFVAVIGRAMKPFMGFLKLRPGIKLPAGASALLPDDGVSFEAGLAELRTQVARIEGGEQMQQKSPLFGRLSHDRWRRMHLDHAAMHLGFLRDTKETTPA